MRTAEWQLLDSELWIWLGNIHFEHRSDLYPILREWMEEFINGYPYILEDDFDNPWVEANAGTYPGPMAVVHSKSGRYALFGSSDVQLLRSHQAEYGLSWCGGLHLHIFENLEEIEQQLAAWHGQPSTVLDRFLKPPLFSLATGGDAEGLNVRPGQRNLDELLDQAAQIATKLGFEWRPLSSASAG